MNAPTVAEAPDRFVRLCVTNTLAGSISILGVQSTELVAEGAVDALRDFLVLSIGARAAYNLLQTAADDIIEFLPPEVRQIGVIS